MSPGKRTALGRGALFLVLWIALIGVSISTLAIGVIATVGATWVSLYLLPPAPQRVRLGALIALLPRFLWQSLLAGLTSRGAPWRRVCT